MLFAYIFHRHRLGALLMLLFAVSSARSLPTTKFTPPDILWLDENEVCQKSVFSAKTHVCRILDDCKTAIQDIRDNVKFPTICSFKGKMPVVCCAPETVSREERLDTSENDIPEVPVLPGITLHFQSYKDGTIKENLITYSRPRRRIPSRVL